MTIPKQVQAQLEEVERIDAEILAAQQPPADVPPEVETPPAPEPPKDTPAVESDVPPAPAPEAATIPEAPKVGEDTWERRFKSLKGKYDAEVPRLTTELKDLRRDLAALTEATKAKPPEPTKPLVNEKDVENFGSDLLDVIDRKAREVAATMVGTEMAELKAENQTLREQVDGVSERQGSSDRRTYFAELGHQVPDWETINVDEGFIEWLSEVDPLSGRPRQDYLGTAFANHDVPRTAALFNTYKQLTAPPASPAKVTPPDLERQVAPGTSKASASSPPNPAAEKVWSMSEIDTFYRAVSKGEYRDNPTEAARIETEIDLAVASGRLRA